MYSDFMNVPVMCDHVTCKMIIARMYMVQGDQKVSVHLMITIIRCTETF